VQNVLYSLLAFAFTSVHSISPEPEFVKV